MKIINILAKILLGIASILPCIFFILGAVVLTCGSSSNICMAVLYVLTILSVLGLLIFYIVNVYRNNGVVENQKALWAALLFFGNIVIYPVYWYLHIWREPKKTTLEEFFNKLK